MSILIKNGTVLTLDESDRILQGGDVLIEGNRIAAVGEALSAENVEQVIDARGQLVMPGLNVAHAHSFAQLFKGVFDGRPLDVWILDTNAPPLGWLASPRQFYLRTVLGAIDLIRHGATTLWDDMFLTPDKQDCLYQAYLESGLRTVLTATMYDRIFPDRTVFLRDRLPADYIGPLSTEKVLPVAEWMQASEEVIRKWHGHAGRLSFSISVAWPQGSSDELLIASAALAEKYDLSFVTHVLETKMQQVTGEVFYGKSMVRRLYDLGVLSRRSSIVHGIWITDEDIELLAEKGATVLHNPGSNLIMGSGAMPMKKLMRAGVNIALGVDEGIQTRWDPFEMMRIAMYIQRAAERDPDNWPSPAEILNMTTAGGARAEMMEGQTGSLAPGMKADVILLDLQAPCFTPLNDIKSQLLFGASGSLVRSSIIDGNLVMRDGKILTVDQDALLEEARQLMPEYWRVHEARNTLEFPCKVRPYVEEIYRKIAAAPTGINRWLGDEAEWINTQEKPFWRS